MRHPALPQKMTTEQLAKWLTENKADFKIHEEEVPLTQEQVHDYENKIALASTKLYELEALKKFFNDRIKNGTPFENDQYVPLDVQIPPTKGAKELEANRKMFTQILEKGFTTVDTNLYGIPYPEEKCTVFFDITGKQWEQYTESFNPDQKKKHKTLFVSGDDGMIKDETSPLSV
jgi:hypothetical protein